MPLSEVKAHFSKLVEDVERTHPAAQRRIAKSEVEITRDEWLDEAALRAMIRRQVT